LLACGLARAYDFAGLKPEGYLSDFARVVDAQARQQLERYAKLVEDSTGAQMAFVTLPTLAGEPIEDVAIDLFRKWGIGQKDKHTGLLLLLVPRERRMRLEVGYGLGGIIPDGYAGSVLRAMRPALREGQYGEALLAGAHELGARLAAAKNVTLAEAPQPSRRRPAREAPVPVAAVLGGLVVLALLSGAVGARRRRYYHGGGSWLPALLLTGLASRSWGSSRGGGGFGGYDSGDSFGGFGGGDSGGGGASSDW
jgi:uncharacterized protein